AHDPPVARLDEHRSCSAQRSKLCPCPLASPVSVSTERKTLAWAMVYELALARAGKDEPYRRRMSDVDPPSAGDGRSCGEPRIASIRPPARALMAAPPRSGR